MKPMIRRVVSLRNPRITVPMQELPIKADKCITAVGRAEPLGTFGLTTASPLSRHPANSYGRLAINLFCWKTTDYSELMK